MSVVCIRRWVLAAITVSVACGAEEVDPQVLAGSDDDCVLACATDDDCCPGYACLQQNCSPHLADDRCWRAAFDLVCDPRLDGECAEGEACTTEDAINVQCFPQDLLGLEADQCDDEGTGCGPGLWCTGRGCRRACCSDAECLKNEHCNVEHGQIGSFGTCG